MSTIISGLYSYKDIYSSSKIAILPSCLQLNSKNEEALLVRLLTGNIEITGVNNQKNTIKIKKNNMALPADGLLSNPVIVIQKALELDIRDAQIVQSLDEYFANNIKNRKTYRFLVNELAQFFLYEKICPSTAFTHLYRSVELISYSFPMIYSILTKDFEKSFGALKGFIIDRNTNQLSFFKRFLKALYDGNGFIQAFVFDIVFVGNEQAEVAKELVRIAAEEKIAFEVQNGVGKIEFLSVVELFIAIRNRYFHMATGSEQTNITAFNYNVEDFFMAINPMMINWVSVIIGSVIYASYINF